MSLEMQANFNLCFADICDAESVETDQQSNRFVQPMSEVRAFCVLMVMLFLFLHYASCRYLTVLYSTDYHFNDER